MEKCRSRRRKNWLHTSVKTINFIRDHLLFLLWPWNIKNGGKCWRSESSVWTSLWKLIAKHTNKNNREGCLVQTLILFFSKDVVRSLTCTFITQRKRSFWTVTFDWTYVRRIVDDVTNAEYWASMLWGKVFVDCLTLISKSGVKLIGQFFFQ